MLKKVAVSATALTVLFNWLVLDINPGLGLSLFLLATNAYLFLFRNSHSSETKWAAVATMVSSIFALLLIVRANPLVQLINIVASVFSMGIAGYLYKIEAGHSKVERIIWYPFLLAGKTLTAFGDAYSEIKKSVNKRQESAKVVPAVLRGLLFAAPIFLVLLFLLAAGDRVFNTLIESLFQKTDLFSQISDRAFFTAAVAVGAVLVAFAKVSPWKTNPLQTAPAVDRSIELSVVAGSVGLVFAAFILVQIKYLFSNVAIEELSSIGISSATYSEYVRNGFFQLLTAAAIAGGVIVTVLYSVQRLSDATREWQLRWITAVVGVETLLVLFSAAKRLSLYAEYHGLTRSRIVGFTFLIWLGLLLLFVTARVVKKLEYNVLVAAVLVTTCLSLFSLTLVNMDRLIAVNYQPTVNSEIDYRYTSGLSADAVDGWREAVLSSEALVLELEAKPILTADDNRKIFYLISTLANLKRNSEYLEKNTNWKAYTAGEQYARDVIFTENSPFGKVSELEERAQVLRGKVTEEVRQSTRLDR